MKNGQNCLVSFAFWREISPEASVRMTLLCRYQSIYRPVCKWQYPVLFYLNFLVTCCIAFYLKIFAHYATAHKLRMLLSTLKTIVMTTLTHREDHPPLLFDNTLLPKRIRLHTWLLFHHSLCRYTHILQLHQKEMTRINCLRLFANTVPGRTLLINYKTNILPNCVMVAISVTTVPMVTNKFIKSQFSAVKVMSGWINNTSSIDELTDLNLIILSRRRKSLCSITLTI